jgi:hypothetical protein
MTAFRDQAPWELALRLSDPGTIVPPAAVMANRHINVCCEIRHA